MYSFQDLLLFVGFISLLSSLVTIFTVAGICQSQETIELLSGGRFW